MLEVLLVCAIGAEMAEGWQPEPSKVLMAILGPGEALAVGG